MLSIREAWISHSKNAIDEACLCLPEANWQQWNARNRIEIANSEEEGKKMWHILQVEDGDKKILHFKEEKEHKLPRKLWSDT